jgi:hypothetical protein
MRQQTKDKDDLRTECSCGTLSYNGGWCFGCGAYRPSKSPRHADEQDLTEHGQTSLGHRLSEFGWPPNRWNE